MKAKLLAVLKKLKEKLENTSSDDIKLKKFYNELFFKFFNNFINFISNDIKILESKHTNMNNLLNLLINIEDYGTHVLTLGVNESGFYVNGVNVSSLKSNNLLNPNILGFLLNYVKIFNETIFLESKYEYMVLKNSSMNQQSIVNKIQKIEQILSMISKFEDYNMNLFSEISAKNINTFQMRKDLFKIRSRRLGVGTQIKIYQKLMITYLDLLEIFSYDLD